MSPTPYTPSMQITANRYPHPPSRRLPRPPAQPADLKDQLVQLSRQGQLAYRCGLAGLGAVAAGSGVAVAGLALHSARGFAVGLAVAGLGACLLPVSLMNLVIATDKAQKLEPRLRQAFPEEFSRG